MDEREWLDAIDPRPMLQALPSNVSDRVLRLFAVACCRRIFHLLDDELGAQAIKNAEACADGLITVHELFAILENRDFRFNYELDEAIAKQKQVSRETISAAMFAASLIMGFLDTKQIVNITDWAANAVALEKIGNAIDEFEYDDQEAYEKTTLPYKKQERLAQSILLRDIVPNPFQKLKFHANWRTSECVQLAKAIYRDEGFGRLPELRKKLIEAGCDNNDILEHCHLTKGHVRGCWVLDTLIGRNVDSAL